ncbi:MAG: MBL fold metallo-hydrolase [Phycisphaeraceae bacterium]|nr:MBL fold metallo-hydrolase [Phycisphaeraceae bacterium]
MAERLIPSVVTSAELLNRLERSQDVFVIDVRSRDEFERLHIEGRSPLPAFNVPYFEMLELGGKDDMIDSVEAYAERELKEKLPTDKQILTVCAKGDTSSYVAQALTRLGYSCANLEGGMKAWGEYYATHTIVEEPDLSIYQISRPARGCLSYVVASSGSAIVIDPLRHVHHYTELAREKNLKIETVIDTHGHADHISGGVELAARSRASYYLHPYDAIHPIDVLPATIDYEYIANDRVFRSGSRELRTIHIPGHTLGVIALALDDRFLFTGDSIFIRSIARPDLGGKAETWAPLHARSLRKLLALNGRIKVLPGHFSSLAEADSSGRFVASLDELKRTNDGLVVLQRDTEEGFVRYLVESLPRFVPEYVDIKRVNAGLLSADEESAAALETGKNVCALSQAYAARAGATP